LAMCYQLSERLQDAMEIFENVVEHPDFVFGEGERGKGSFVQAKTRQGSEAMSSPSRSPDSAAPSLASSTDGNMSSQASRSHLTASTGGTGSRIGSEVAPTPNPPSSPKGKRLASDAPAPSSPKGRRGQSPKHSRAPLPSLPSKENVNSSVSTGPPSPRGDEERAADEAEEEEQLNQLIQGKGKSKIKKKKTVIPLELFDGPEEKKVDDKEAEFKKKVESEIVTSEKVYNEQIKVLLEEYMKPLSMCMEQAEMAKEYKATLFGNIDSIYRVSNELIAAMEGAVEKQTSLADVLIEMEEPILRAYAQYVSNYHTAVSLLGRILETEETSLCATVKDIEKDLMDRGVQPLQALLIQPVQRCPRYVLLLKNALQYTPVVHEDWNGYRIVVNKYEKLAERVNAAKTTNEHLEAIMKIQKQISGNPLNLAEPGRKFIHSGSHIVKSKDVRPGMPKDTQTQLVGHKEKDKDKENEENTGTIFLFSDTLLFTRETKSLLSNNDSRGGVFGAFVNDTLASTAYDFVGFLLLECLEVVDVEDDNFALGFRYKGQKEEDTYYIETNHSDEKQKWMDIIAEQQELLGLMDKKNDKNRAIVKSGWFHKRGNIVKSVNKRWFTLQGHTLFYFHDEQDKNPKGSINLLEYTLERDLSEDTKKLFCVRISHTTKRNFWVWFETHQDLEDWVKVMSPNVLHVKMSNVF